ncbi:MAG: hypothetical protein AAF567_19645 [Actinomycetota bacterium]
MTRATPPPTPRIKERRLGTPDEHGISRIVPPIDDGMRVNLDPTTAYFDGVDPDRRGQLRPYDVRSGMYGRSDIEGLLCGWNMHHCYGVEHHRKRPFICVDPLIRYRDLLEGFLEVDRYRFVPYRDYSLASVDDDAVTALIRHDVDGDIVAAREMARIEAEYGIRSTYFVLHTAPYHATFEDGVVHRYEEVAELYLEIQDLGHEIAIHSDPLGLYQDFGLDGAAGLVDELEWMRSRGLRVVGTLAHNSFGVYGANNYTMFEGRPLTDYFGAGSARAVEHNGRWSPIQQLDEAQLGLEYEGNEVFWQHEVPVRYWCLMHQGMWARQPDFYGTRLPERLRPQTSLTWHSQDEVLDDAHTVPNGEIAVIVVHPLHYGLRCHENESPATVISRTMPKPGDWLRHVKTTPGATVDIRSTQVGETSTKSRLKRLVGREPKNHALPISVRSAFLGDRLEATGIDVDYGNGLIDRPADHFDTSADHRVLFVGGADLGNRLLPSESRTSRLLVRRLEFEHGKSVDSVRSMTWAPTDPTAKDFDRLLDELGDAGPTMIVAGFDVESLRANPRLIERLRTDAGSRYMLLALAIPGPSNDPELHDRVQDALQTQTFDPSPRFDTYAEATGRKLHFDSTGRWNHQAHWLAAGLLVDGLGSVLCPTED